MKTSPTLPAPGPAPLLVSAAEAAKLLGIGGRLLWSMSVSGTLPSLKIGARRMYSVNALRQWIIDRQRQNGGQA